MQRVSRRAPLKGAMETQISNFSTVLATFTPD